MEFLSRRRAKPDRLGILPGSFNPPTLAHLALAEAALAELMRWCWSCRAFFPTKPTMAPALPSARTCCAPVLGHHPRLAAAVSVGGLFHRDCARVPRRLWSQRPIGIYMRPGCG